MADIIPDPVFSDVPQYEIFTVAEGGTGGPMNAPIQALANRTEFLNQITDSADPAKGAAIVGYAGRNVAEKLNDAVSPMDFGAAGDGIANDTAAVAISSGVEPYTFSTTNDQPANINRLYDQLITSPARRHSDRTIEGKPLTPPSGLGFTPQILPIYTAGKWRGDKSALSLFPAASGADYYVDPVLGFGGAAGTQAAPMKSVLEALQKPDVGRVFVAPAPNSSRDDGIWGNPNVITSENSITVLPWNIRPGRPSMMGTWQHYPQNWVQESPTLTRAWMANRTTVIAVWQFFGDEDGQELVQVGTQAETQNRPGSYHYDGAKLTVHTVNSTPPDRSLKVFIGNTVGYWTSNKNLYVQGIDFFGGLNSFWVPDSSANIVLSDCRMGFTPGNALTIFSSGNIVVENCRAISAKLDGFNYHPSATHGAGTVVEINCSGKMCGWGGTSNQLSTMHGGIKGVRIGGDFSGAEHHGIADVNEGTVTWNVGGSAGLSRTTSTASLGVFLSSSTAYFYDFDFGNSKGGLALNNGQAYLHNSKPFTFTLAGDSGIGEYKQI